MESEGVKFPFFLLQDHFPTESRKLLTDQSCLTDSLFKAATAPFSLGKEPQHWMWMNEKYLKNK